MRGHHLPAVLDDLFLFLEMDEANTKLLPGNYTYVDTHGPLHNTRLCTPDHTYVDTHGHHLLQHNRCTQA